MPVRFGEHQLCPRCDGSGLGPIDKTERARQLRLAKRTGDEPPKISRPTCFRCNGSGYIVHETLSKVDASEVWPQ